MKIVSTRILGKAKEASAKRYAPASGSEEGIGIGDRKLQIPRQAQDDHKKKKPTVRKALTVAT
ncbi:MAG: hypothetical protein A3F68_12190 [Acidobacteria bacterium RIFCSPLOWO2_12_FULL_54_10]|nr:MAG: hypothetical protein A3F68_12190 [Acidobacteria bacterium RIFCSPLOWO2_12_FULL_54_10]